MGKEQMQFLELLKSALWGRAADAGCIGEDVDWKALYGLAKKQASLGMVYEGLLSLPEEKRPNRLALLKWGGMAMEMENRYAKHLQTLDEICRTFATERPILLKGLGLASLYPNPKRRQLGDIDLFLPGLTQEGMSDLVGKRGVEVTEEPTERHLEIVKNGVSIELHWRMAKSINPFRNAKLDALADEAVRQAQAVRLAGVEVFLLPADFNAVYLLLHQVVHLLDRGLGLRQVADWALFLKHHRDDFDVDRLGRMLRSLGMMDEWKLFECYCVGYLGLDPECAPFYDASFGRKARQLNEVIFEFGNFGNFADDWANRPGTYWKRKVHAFSVNLKLHRKIFSILPADSLLTFFFTYLPSALGRLCPKCLR